MIHKKVLLLTTYPTHNPQHGGQKRAQAIYEMYKLSFAAVRQSAVFFRGFYSSHGRYDIPLGSHSEARVAQSPLTGDIICGEAIYKDPKVRHKMMKLLLGFQPDIIHIEQPFPYLGLKPLLKELDLQPRLVFGSQNVEAPMKREILEGADVPEADIVNAETIIQGIEDELTRDSDLVVACTKEDLKIHADAGARKLVLAPNGIAKIKTNGSARAYWRKRFNEAGVAKKVLFVGSAHPPNWTGFLDVVGKGLGFMPPDARIVIAGSISDYFEREISKDNLSTEDSTFWLRAVSAGRLSENRLGALIEASDIMLLPLTEGGGSNLKTAEAILADKKVVTTTHALRSFEWFKNFPNVWVADDQPAFQSAIRDALEADYKKRTQAQVKQANTVRWESCLADMVKEVAAL